MVGRGRTTCLARCCVIYMPCRQVVAVTAKVHAMVRVKVEAKVERLDGRF